MFKLRFWWIVFWAWLNRRSQVVSGRLRFWVTPFECDINLHMNNASYLKFMDLGRWDIFLRSGMAPVAIKTGLRPVVVRIEIDYRKVLPPGTFFVLETTFLDMKEKTFHLRQVFKVGDKVVAEARVTAVFIREGHAVPVEAFLEHVPSEIRQKLLIGNPEESR